jgi:tetratricopeptide (TPR) repeat protein
LVLNVNEKEIDNLLTVSLNTDYSVGLKRDDNALKIANDHKEEGNRRFASNDFAGACESYSSGINLRGVIAKDVAARLYANRSQARLKLRQFNDALRDAEEATKLDPDWFKAHARLAACHEALRRFGDACAALERALALAPAVSRPELEQSLNNCREQLDKESRNEHENLQYTSVLSAGLVASLNASAGRPAESSPSLLNYDTIPFNVLSLGTKILLEAQKARIERRWTDYVSLLVQAARGYKVCHFYDSVLLI